MSLPVELVEEIFSYVAFSTDAKSLRLACRIYAVIGIPFVFSSTYTHYPWRDLAQLHDISEHDDLRHVIKTIRFNFSDLNEYEARHASFFENWLMEPESRNEALQNAWQHEYYTKKGQKNELPSFQSRLDLLSVAMSKLPSLWSVHVTWNECPFDNAILRQTFDRIKCRKVDVAEAAIDLDIIMRALTHRGKIEELLIDRARAIAPVSDGKWHHALEGSWAESKLILGPSLSRLDLTFDRGSPMSEQSAPIVARFVPYCENLSYLALDLSGASKATWHQGRAFANLGKAVIESTFPGLEELRIIGGNNISLVKLRAFFRRHAGTLRRLRLECPDIELVGGHFPGLEAFASVDVSGSQDEESGNLLDTLLRIEETLPGLEHFAIHAHVLQRDDGSSLDILHISTPADATSRILGSTGLWTPPQFKAGTPDIRARIPLHNEGYFTMT